MFQDDQPADSNHHEPILRDPKQLTFPFAREDRDFRSPRDIAVDIVEKIFAEGGEDWNEDMNGARPMIRISTHREHVSPVGKERRRIAPLSAPMAPPLRNVVRTQVADLRDDDGKIDLDEIRNRAKPKPADVSNYSVGRRAAIIITAIIALSAILGGGAATKRASEPPTFLKGIVESLDAVNTATGEPKPHRKINSPTLRGDESETRP